MSHYNVYLNNFTLFFQDSIHINIFIVLNYSNLHFTCGIYGHRFQQVADFKLYV